MVKASAKKTANSESTVQAVPEVAVPPSKTASRGKKTQEAAPVTPATPVVETTLQTSSKKGGKRSQETTATAPVAPAVATPAAPVQTGGKKSKKTTPVVEVVEPVVAAVEGQDDGTQVRGKRFFRCLYRATDGSVVNAGRYSGKKPKQAASKAFTAIVKKNNVTTGESVTFLIQECTRGSRKKKYSYEGSQVNLPTPVEIKIKKKDGTFSQISYAKNNVLKKIALSECNDLVNVELADEEAAPVQEAGVKGQSDATKRRMVVKKVKKSEKPTRKSASTTTSTSTSTKTTKSK